MISLGKDGGRCNVLWCSGTLPWENIVASVFALGTLRSLGCEETQVSLLEDETIWRTKAVPIPPVPVIEAILDSPAPVRLSNDAVT
jgi:hypothetical protein